MKRLTLIRHAKSSWQYPELTDFERPLNDRGRRDAPILAQRIAKLLPAASRLLVSPATRTMSTARVLAGALHIDDDALHILPGLYEASRVQLLQILQTQDGNPNHVMLVGHNPGISELAHSLAPCSFEDMPTAAFAHLSLDIRSWKELRAGCGELSHYGFPKDGS